MNNYKKGQAHHFRCVKKCGGQASTSGTLPIKDYYRKKKNIERDDVDL